MRFVDIMLSIPGLLMAIGIAALLGPSLQSVMIAIAVINVPIFARPLRGQMLGQWGSDYVLAQHLGRQTPTSNRAGSCATELDVAGDRGGHTHVGHRHHRSRGSVLPRLGQP